MLLLDLPPEMFQHIVHDLVSTIGIREAWKLRRTCRKFYPEYKIIYANLSGTFAGEIAHDIVTSQPKEQLLGWRERRLIVANIPTYLYNRVKVPFDVDEPLLRKVKGMAEYLYKSLHIGTEVQRNATLMKICQMLPKTFGNEKVLTALWGPHPQHNLWDLVPDRRAAIRGEINGWDKLAAAVAVGAHDLARDLLKRIPGPVASRISRGPLDDAIIMQDPKMVRVVLDHLRSLELKKAAKRGLKKKYLTSVDSAFHLRHNISTSIQESQAQGDITQALVDLYEELLPLPSHEDSRSWLAAAIEHRNVAALSIISSMPYRTPWKVPSALFREACRTGGRAYVDILLDNLPLEFDKGSITTLPLFQAVRTGSVPCAEAVLERSKTALSMQVRSNLRTKSLRDKDISALELAIHRGDAAMVKCLLDNGSPYPPPEEWPKDGEIRDLLRAAADDG